MRKDFFEVKSLTWAKLESCHSSPYLTVTKYFQVKGFDEAGVSDISQSCSAEHRYRTTNSLAPKAAYTNATFPLDNGWLVNLCFDFYPLSAVFTWL